MQICLGCGCGHHCFELASWNFEAELALPELAADLVGGFATMEDGVECDSAMEEPRVL